MAINKQRLCAVFRGTPRVESEGLRARQGVDRTDSPEMVPVALIRFFPHSMRAGSWSIRNLPPSRASPFSNGRRLRRGSSSTQTWWPRLDRALLVTNVGPTSGEAGISVVLNGPAPRWVQLRREAQTTHEAPTLPPHLLRRENPHHSGTHDRYL